MTTVLRTSTAAEVILVAAYDLVDGGLIEFTAAQLVVAAYRRDSRRFGLPGFDHPHSQRVLCEIMGKKPRSPIVMGLLVKVRPSVYRLTEAGIDEAIRLKAKCRWPNATMPTAGEVKRKQLADQLAACDRLLSEIHTTNGDRPRIDAIRRDIAAVTGGSL